MAQGEARCRRCRRLLAMVTEAGAGAVEIRCNRCRADNRISGRTVHGHLVVDVTLPLAVDTPG